jgi:hypothetical protein
MHICRCEPLLLCCTAAASYAALLSGNATHTKTQLLRSPDVPQYCVHSCRE